MHVSIKTLGAAATVVATLSVGCVADAVDEDSTAVVEEGVKGNMLLAGSFESGDWQSASAVGGWAIHAVGNTSNAARHEGGFESAQGLRVRDGDSGTVRVFQRTSLAPSPAVYRLFAWSRHVQGGATQHLEIAFLDKNGQVISHERISPTEPTPVTCGGFAALPCPNDEACVDYPNDSCDPKGGGADCLGYCPNMTNAIWTKTMVASPAPAGAKYVQASVIGSSASSADEVRDWDSFLLLATPFIK